jgi:hypothetical protein|tara:strand:- start:9 stop:338 length:330 start_codon:yes stop_codon:yes gene_type:complete
MLQEVVPRGLSLNGSSGCIEGLVNGHNPIHIAGRSRVLVHKLCFTPFTQTHLHAASDDFGTVISKANNTSAANVAAINVFIENILYNQAQQEKKNNLDLDQNIPKPEAR